MTALDQAQAHDDVKGTCTIHWWGEAHDGAGWYYVDDEYPEEGSVGSFLHLGECVAHAINGGYTISGADDSQLVEGMRVVEVAANPDERPGKDIKRLVRELDIIWNGEEGAAKQASLCDVVGQLAQEVPRERARIRELTEERDSARRGQIACGEKMGALDAEYRMRAGEFNRITEMFERERDAALAKFMGLRDGLLAAMDQVGGGTELSETLGAIIAEATDRFPVDEPGEAPKPSAMPGATKDHCPHPARHGDHEEYSGGTEGAWYCRACGFSADPSDPTQGEG